MTTANNFQMMENPFSPPAVENLLIDPVYHRKHLLLLHSRLMGANNKQFGPIQHLIVDDVDPETIWEQINYHNRPHNRYVTRMIAVLRRRVKIKVSEDIVMKY